MNKFSKFSLVVFSIIVLVISVVLMLITNSVVTVESFATALNVFVDLVEGSPYVWNFVFSLFGISAIVAMFSSKEEDENKKGIKIKYEKGMLYLSKETFENLALSVVKKHSGISNSKAQIKFAKDGIEVDVYVYLYSDVVVSEITTKLQKEITDSIIKCTTANVKSVNIKVKGVITKATETKTK